MTPGELHDHLRALVSSAPEHRLVVDLGDRLLEAAAEERDQVVERWLGNHAEDLLALPWQCALAPEIAQAAVRQVPDLADPLAVLRSQLVRAGGAMLAHLTMDGLWVPRFYLRETERRLGLAAPELPTRWVLTRRLPVPHEQVRVDPWLLRPDERLAVAEIGLAAPVACAGPAFPEGMLADPGWHHLLGDELRQMAQVDAVAAMRQVLGGFGSPMVGVLQILGSTALYDVARSQEAGRRWQGVVGGAMQVGLVPGGRLLLSPDFLRVVLMALGLPVPFLPANGLVETEADLVLRSGSEGIPQEDGNKAFVINADDASGFLAMPIDWAGVMRADV